MAMTDTPLRRGKMGLCQKLRGCDGPFFLPCGRKTDNPKNCEKWKVIPLRRKDLILDKKDKNSIQISDESFARIEREFKATI